MQVYYVAFQKAFTKLINTLHQRFDKYLRSFCRHNWLCGMDIRPARQILNLARILSQVKRADIHKELIILFILLLNAGFMNGQDTIQEIVYKPIGVFHSPFNVKTGAPRQGILMPETRGTIEIYPQYQSGLTTLNFFEYIIVLYHFSKVEKWQPIVNPPASSHEHNFGLFSTRSPKRPNPIGLSIVKLEKIENGILYISGIDAFEGTPVLDIKPYLPSVDCVKSILNELLEKELGHHDEDFISDSTFFK